MAASAYKPSFPQSKLFPGILSHQSFSLYRLEEVNMLLLKKVDPLEELKSRITCDAMMTKMFAAIERQKRGMRKRKYRRNIPKTTSWLICF
jgi:hypothetical protein